jgi:hypothetical protein
MSATLIRARRGRPRLQAGSESVLVCVRVPVSLHDAVIKHALARDVPATQVYRDSAISYLKNRQPDQPR